MDRVQSKNMELARFAGVSPGVATSGPRKRVDIRPGGKGKTFMCVPPELALVAVREVMDLSPKITKASLTPDVPGGVRIFVGERYQVYEDDLKGAFGWVLKSVEVKSAVTFRGGLGDEEEFVWRAISNKIVAELNLTEKEKDCIPIVEWLYAFAGRTSDKADNAFLLLSVDAMKDLGFIVDVTNATRQMKRMSAIDPENIRLYDDAAPQMINAETLPDVPDSFIYNPLTYRPAGNALVAVRKGNICKALSNCTSPVARSMGDLMSRCFEYFLNGRAAAHAEQVGKKTFEATVAAPADESLKGYLTAGHGAVKRKLIETEMELVVSRIETKKEKLSRLQAESNAVETEIKLEDEELAHKQTEAARLLAICDKEYLKATFDNHLVINRPIQTKMHPGDNHPRVGCAVLKVTEPDESELAAYVYKHGHQVKEAASEDAKPVFLSLHVSEITAGNTQPATVAGCFRACTRLRHSKYKEADGYALVLLGGCNVIRTRSVLREKMRVFSADDSRRKNNLFYVLPGEYQAAMRGIKETCEQSYAAGVLDGKLLFTNRAILDSLCESDRAAVVRIVLSLSGVCLD